MKKAISLLLCLCVAFSLLPTSPAKAANGGSGGATTPEVTELYYAVTSVAQDIQPLANAQLSVELNTSMFIKL
ncbi:MAG: hypothetical protein RSE64_08810, partial [Oscillospiraceae bacterium]